MIESDYKGLTFINTEVNFVPKGQVCGIEPHLFTKFSNGYREYHSESNINKSRSHVSLIFVNGNHFF